MNSVGTLQKRLHDETAAVEKDIESHHQQVEALSRRLEGLKRAAELFDSEQAPIADNDFRLAQLKAAVSLSRSLRRRPQQMQKAALSTKATTARKQVERNGQIDRGKTKTAPNARAASNNGGLTRVEMIGAVLRRHPRRTVRELIALLDREYHWTTTESAVTGHLYIHRDKFLHTPPDRATNRNRPVTWSSK